MELQKFVKDFAAEFTETDESVFESSTNYRELDEWDSVMALSIISMVDDNYGKRISGNELRKCQTIEDLFLLVSSL
jgi:acyl carrier protein